jgi:hypothetical protein
MFQDINIDFDPIRYMQEIAILIEGIPNIEKLYAPDFLLDENGDYDDSFVNTYLTIFQDKDSRCSKIPYMDYTGLKLTEILENVPLPKSQRQESKGVEVLVNSIGTPKTNSPEFTILKEAAKGSTTSSSQEEKKTAINKSKTKDIFIW